MKNYIGLDIGTTSVSAVRVANGTVQESVTLNGAPFLCQTARTQDADEAVRLALSALSRLQNKDTAAIGVTGQMHGIVYVDNSGNAVSPLYTWQNPYGNEPFPCAENEKTCGESGFSAEACGENEKTCGESYANRLSAITGYPMASGYGITTLFYHTVRGEVPQSAAKICTVHDYLAMKLTGRTTPLLHPSNAASFGAFDLSAAAFDRAALAKAKIPLQLLPDVAADDFPQAADGFLGKTADSIPVTLAVGDNQAAVFGALCGEGVSVNVGTGSQVSVVLSTLPKAPTYEVRPYLFGQYLGVECPLCGGRSYALLLEFFANATAAFGMPNSAFAESGYAALNALGEEGERLAASGAPLPVFDPLFCGTRQQPDARASVNGISAENFTPAALTYSLILGMAEELHRGYRKMSGKTEASVLAASGNGIRKNPVLARALQRKFGTAITLPEGKEEAAFGAAKYAARLYEEKQ